MNARIYVLHHDRIGTNKDGPGGALTPFVQGLTPIGGAMEQSTNPKTTVRKCADRWIVSCPCGFEWRTRWHRLALILATSHEHRAAA